MTDDRDDLKANPDKVDAGESFQDSGPDQPRHSKIYLAFRFLSENMMFVITGVGILAFVVLAVLGYELPRNVKIISLSALITIPLAGRPTANKTKDLLWNPNDIFIVDIDVTDEWDGGIYTIPSQRFREWDVTDGSLDWENPTLAFGKRVDLEEQTVQGCWKGTLTDRQLMTALSAVEECRGQLEEDAKRGFVIEAQAFSIIRNATRQAVLRIVSTFERGTLPDQGEGLTDEIDAAIEKFGIERKIREDESDDAPDSDVAGGDLIDRINSAGGDEHRGASADD